jgi:hypothetical protein
MYKTIAEKNLKNKNRKVVEKGTFFTGGRFDEDL